MCVSKHVSSFVVRRPSVGNVGSGFSRLALRDLKGRAADRLSETSQLLNAHHGSLMAQRASQQRPGKGGAWKCVLCDCGKNLVQWKRCKNCGSCDGRREPTFGGQRPMAQAAAAWRCREALQAQVHRGSGSGAERESVGRALRRLQGR